MAADIIKIETRGENAKFKIEELAEPECAGGGFTPISPASRDGYGERKLMWQVILEVGKSLGLLIGSLRRLTSAATESTIVRRETRRNASRVERRTFGESPKETGGSPVLPIMDFDVSALISRRLEQKRPIFAPFLTLNHLDFSPLTKKMAKNIFDNVTAGHRFHGKSEESAPINPALRDGYQKTKLQVADDFGG
jgi:hypothetical protein